jgi:hypothetical protein
MILPLSSDVSGGTTAGLIGRAGPVETPLRGSRPATIVAELAELRFFIA